MNSNEYSIKNFINRGINLVYEAVHVPTGNTRCIKFVQIEDERARNRFLKEVQILQETKDHPHPNIIGYDTHYFEEKQSIRNEIYTTGCIVMEKGITNLHNFIQKKNKEKTGFEEHEVAEFFLSMLRAHSHLQNLQIAHRDIKPENIILFDQENLLFKICDVGFSTQVSDEITKTLTIGGTVAYFSPEMFRAYNSHQPFAKYNPYKSDVFSLGLVFLYFATQQEIDKSKRMEVYRDEGELDKYLKKQRKLVKLKYSRLNGISKILKYMLEIKETIRVDFIQLMQIIEANEYLEVKSVILPFNKPKKVTHSNWQSITTIKDLQIEIFDQENVEIDLNNIGKSPLEIQKILENLARQVKHYQMKSFKLKVELNNLNVRQITPVAKILSRANKLQELELHFWNNKLGNLGLLLLCRAMTNLNELKRLYISLSNNIITDIGINQSLPMLTNFNLVEDLFFDFGMNQLPIECCEIFFQIIQTMPKLKKLDLNLESNHMNLVISKLLLKTIKQLPLLTHIVVNFSNNLLLDEGLFEIGEAMNQFHHCSLILWSCSIRDKGLAEFGRALINAEKLKEFHLILWNNLLTDKGCEELAKSLISLKTITILTLNLSNNKLGDQGVRNLAKAIWEMPQLKDLKFLLDNVQCTSFGLRYVSKFLQNLKQLTKINLNFRTNEINNQGIDLLYVGFAEAIQLTEVTITLDYNPLGDEGIHTLMKGLQKLKALQILNLNLENVQGTSVSVSCFIDSIQNWKYLKSLNINFSKNETDESDSINCKNRLNELKSEATLMITLKERIRKA